MFFSFSIIGVNIVTLEYRVISNLPSIAPHKATIQVLAYHGLTNVAVILKAFFPPFEGPSLRDITVGYPQRNYNERGHVLRFLPYHKKFKINFSIILNLLRRKDLTMTHLLNTSA